MSTTLKSEKESRRRLRTTTMTEPGGQRVSASHAEQLIPGISDEITLNTISTKLAWEDIHKLVLVSRGWLRAIRTRQVYDARVRSNSTENVYMCSDSQEIRVLEEHDANVGSISCRQILDTFCSRQPTEYALGITLSAGIDTGCARFDLPPIAGEYFDSVVDAGDRSVALDGKVYVFGGQDRKVHVLDVAGHGRWTQCASVLKAREDFGCGAIDGKIYVFGGAVNHESTSGRELYNPKDDTWSRCRPIVNLRCGVHVGRVPHQFLVDGDQFYNSESVPNKINTSVDGRYVSTSYAKRRSIGQSLQSADANLLEEYDPMEDMWRVVQPVGSEKEKMFVAGGIFYSMNPVGIYVYDFHGHLWTHLHACSFDTAIGVVDDSAELWPIATLTADHEILALLEWPGATNRSCLVQTRGLGSQNEEMVWRKAKCAFPYLYSDNPTVHIKGLISL